MQKKADALILQEFGGGNRARVGRRDPHLPRGNGLETGRQGDDNGRAGQSPLDRRVVAEVGNHEGPAARVLDKSAWRLALHLG